MPCSRQPLASRGALGLHSSAGLQPRAPPCARICPPCHLARRESILLVSFLLPHARTPVTRGSHDCWWLVPTSWPFGVSTRFCRRCCRGIWVFCIVPLFVCECLSLPPPRLPWAVLVVTVRSLNRVACSSGRDWLVWK